MWWGWGVTFTSDLMSRVFTNGPGDRSSIPGRIIRKTQKIVFDASLLNTQHYKMWIKGKVEQSNEWSSALLHISAVAIENGAFGSLSKVSSFTFFISSLPVEDKPHWETYIQVAVKTIHIIEYPIESNWFLIFALPFFENVIQSWKGKNFTYSLISFIYDLVTWNQKKNS